MEFLTSSIRMQQTEQAGLWKTLDNILFKDYDGIIYLVPRYVITDGFTIPDWISWLGGDNMKYDTRCSTVHDFECKYAQKIRVCLSEQSLKQTGFLIKNADGKMICRDLPTRVLKIEKTTFTETNDRFKRMMLCSSNIPKWRSNLMRFAVNFNFGWHSNKEPLNLDDVFLKEL